MLIRINLLINNNLVKYVQKIKIIKNGYLIWDLLLKIKCNFMIKFMILLIQISKIKYQNI